jgi:hypothetical protein
MPNYPVAPINLLAPSASEKPNEMNRLTRKFAIAPMMEWTDRAQKRSVIST